MESPPQIAFKNMETSEALERLIAKRIDRLERLSDRITSCRVVVEVPHRSPGSGKVPLAIAVEVELPGRPLLVAKAEEDRRSLKPDDASFVNQAFEAIERQLRETKEVRNREAVARQESDNVTGVITRLFPEQDYGFVEIVGSPELYFTRNAVIGFDFDQLEVGAMVQVTIASMEGPMGPQASSVRVPKAAQSPA
jgi:ribosome-associated translation inhibitor RaiA